MLDLRLGIREKFFIKSIEYLRLNTSEVSIASDIFKSQACKVDSKPVCQEGFFLLKKGSAFF